MMKNKLASFEISTLKKAVIFLFLLFLPTQFGRHFFLDFSYISGVRIDYLSLIIYVTDILAAAPIFFNFKIIFFDIKKQAKYLLLIIILLSINIFRSRFPILSLYHVLKLVEVYFIFIIFKAQKAESRIINLPLFLGGLVEIVLAVFQFITKSSIQGFFYFLGERYLNLSIADIAKSSINGVEILRPYATFSHPNSMGGFYLLLYFYFLTVAFKKPLLKYASLLIFSLLTLISFSKTVILIFVFLNIFYLFKNRGECRFCPLSSSFGLIITVLIFLRASGDPQSFEKRYTLFLNSFAIIKNHLLFGTGLGHYLIYQASIPIKYNFFFLQPVHNIFLLFFAETGLIFSGVIFYFLIKFVKSNLSKLSFVFCLLVIFITGNVDHYWLTLQQNFLLMGAIFGLLSGGKKV